MTKYVKRPIEVEAVQWFKIGDHPSVESRHVFYPPACNPAILEFYIATLEGIMDVNPGDWIITGIKGEQYPCKDEIFKAIYEEVQEEITNDEVRKNSSRNDQSVGYKDD